MSASEPGTIQQELITAIRVDTQRKTRVILTRIVLTWAVPLAVFMLAGILVNAVRAFVEAQFGDPFLTTTTQASTLLVLFGATWWAARQSEARFGGVRLMRGLLNVSRRVLRVEEAAKGGQTPAEVEQLAYAAWDYYRQVMADAGWQVD